MEGYIGRIALPTNVTFGKCIPSMLCVVDVYLTTSRPLLMLLTLPRPGRKTIFIALDTFESN